MTLSKSGLLLLEAAAELTNRQLELLPLLAKALGRAAFDYWILGDGRGDPTYDAVEATADGQWRFHFHGLEVDVRHAVDGRAVRIDFAPDGKPACTPGGVGAFALASQPPWGVFPELNAILAGPVGYDHTRCVALSDELRQHGLVDYVAPEAVALVTRYRRFDPGRGHVLEIPSELLPADENNLILCDNLLVTEGGHALLRRMRAKMDAAADRR